ncbi:hypothetical protein PINS_up010633 [Pythium insidiosum]|nr:hypothetical protein PINS_up010633 [Pythium insidiosum]
MADLDAEFALFQAELASLEEKNAASTVEETTAHASDDAAAAVASKKRPRDDDDNGNTSNGNGKNHQTTTNDDGDMTTQQPSAKKKSVVVAAPVVIAAKPKIYSAPPRPAPVRDLAPQPIITTATTARSDAFIDSVDASQGALSGFPAGTTGEFAATAGTLASARSQVPMPRVDMVTGQLLSSEEQQQMNMQQSVYEYDPNRPVRSSGAGNNGRGVEYGKPKKNLRMAGGEIWEDPTLADWPDDDFRLFVGDLGNEVNDEILSHAFSRYASFQRARVVA